MDHEIQRSIVLKLIHAPVLSFNALWDKQGESNAFAYHLNKLEKDGLIVKKDDGYGLTDEGRKLSAFIEGDTGSKAAFPTMVVFQIVRQGNKLLCQKRLKEPFYGTWGQVAGKQNFGWNFIECAKRDLKEETDLEADEYVLRGIEQVKTYEKGQMIFHHVMVCVETKNPRGVMRQRTHKAENAWLTLEEYKEKPKFPETWPLEDLFGNKKFQVIESERFMEEGKFVSAKLISKIDF